jgi:hypothetical protein
VSLAQALSTFAVGTAVSTLCGCSTSVFSCSEDENCTQAGVLGVCQPEGFPSLTIDGASVGFSISILDREATRFVLARALWDDDQDRGRALELARRAREALLETGGADAVVHVETIDAWLADHADKTNPRGK